MTADGSSRHCVFNQNTTIFYCAPTNAGFRTPPIVIDATLASQKAYNLSDEEFYGRGDSTLNSMESKTSLSESQAWMAANQTCALRSDFSFTADSDDFQLDKAIIAQQVKAVGLKNMSPPEENDAFSGLENENLSWMESEPGCTVDDIERTGVSAAPHRCSQRREVRNAAVEAIRGTRAMENNDHQHINVTSTAQPSAELTEQILAQVVAYAIASDISLKTTETTSVSVESDDRSGSFICHFCNQSYVMPCDLIEHINTHTSEKPDDGKSASEVMAQQVADLNLSNHRHSNDAIVSGGIDTARTGGDTDSQQCESVIANSLMVGDIPDVNADDEDETEKNRRDKIFSEVVAQAISGDFSLSDVSASTPRQKSGRNGRYICHYCNETYASPYNLRRHINTHTGETPYPCGVCHKSFTNSSKLKEHARIHTGERPYKCDMCDYSFMNSGKLARHVRTIHYGEKRFGCEVCGKSFTQSASVKAHMRIHTGEKPFNCEFCGKSFNQSSTLNGHIRTHTGEKPYICIVCGKAFAQSTSMKIHLRTHNNERSKSDFDRFSENSTSPVQPSV